VKIKIKLLSESKNKIQFVKIIKDCTLLSLLESKHIADYLFQNIGKSKEIELVDPYIKTDILITPSELIKEINNFGDFKITGSISWERDVKLLSLGIGDKSDYLKFFSEYLNFNEKDFNNILLDKIISKIEKEKLVEILNELNI
jgi:hypothetical protein